MISGLYAIADAGAHPDPEHLALEILAGGCRLLQLRCKGWKPDDVTVLARRLASRCREVGATFIINDWPDVAVAAGADGAHIGQTDGALEAARQILGPNRILGRSTNQLDQVPAAARGADYVAFGPMFSTANLSRPKAVQGPERLARARERVDVPLVAIGGLNADRIPMVRAAGADAWAVIGAIARAEDPRAATAALVRCSQ